MRRQDAPLRVGGGLPDVQMTLAVDLWAPVGQLAVKTEQAALLAPLFARSHTVSAACGHPDFCAQRPLRQVLVFGPRKSWMADLPRRPAFERIAPPPEPPDGLMRRTARLSRAHKCPQSVNADGFLGLERDDRVTFGVPRGDGADEWQLFCRSQPK